MKVSYYIKISLRVLLCGGDNNDDDGVSSNDGRDTSGGLWAMKKSFQ